MTSHRTELAAPLDPHSLITLTNPRLGLHRSLPLLARYMDSQRSSITRTEADKRSWGRETERSVTCLPSTAGQTALFSEGGAGTWGWSAGAFMASLWEEPVWILLPISVLTLPATSSYLLRILTAFSYFTESNIINKSCPPPLLQGRSKDRGNQKSGNKTLVLITS